MSRVSDWTARNRLKATLGVGVVLVLAVALLQFPAVVDDPSVAAPDAITLDEALRSLDQRNFGKARELAEKLRYSDGPDKLGGPIFVLGAAAAYEADSLWGKNKLTHHVLAATYLEEARDRGFPESREGEGLFLLGRSLYRSNQLAASRAAFVEVLRLGPEDLADTDRLEALRMIAEAYLADTRSDSREALKVSEEYLASSDLSVKDRDEGVLRHARILFSLDQADQCRAYLAKLSDDAFNLADGMVLDARLFMREAEQLSGSGAVDEATQEKIASRYDQALELFGRVQEHFSASDVTRGQAHYLTGLCLKERGQLKDAISELRKVRNLNVKSGEGLVAALTEADLLAELGDDDAAIRGYRDTVTEIAEQGTFNNSWISQDEIRRRLLDVVGRYVADEKFEHAVQMADLLSPIVRSTQSIQLSAQAQVAWARSLDDRAKTLPRAQRQQTEREARKHYREAGQIYARSARLRFATREYSVDLWNSAENFRLGHDYKNAIQLFDQYLKNESRQRISAALVGLGESHLALGNLDEAIEALTTCIDDHPDDPSNYRARLMAAEAYLGRGDAKQAEALLRTNLRDRHQGPASQEWQASLFALGKVLHGVGRHQDAIPKLVEAVERYPTSPHAMEAQYLIAESFRQAAQEPLKMLEEVTIEANRQQHIEELKELLSEAEKFYEAVRQDLNLRPDSVALTPLESVILRNCYFALGAVYFDQGRLDDEFYERAIRAYSDATNLYQNNPEVLEAFVQIAACYRRLDRPTESRGTLEQAKVVLKQLDENLDFEQTTNFNKRQWEAYLKHLIEFSK